MCVWQSYISQASKGNFQFVLNLVINVLLIRLIFYQKLRTTGNFLYILWHQQFIAADLSYFDPKQQKYKIVLIFLEVHTFIHISGWVLWNEHISWESNKSWFVAKEKDLWPVINMALYFFLCFVMKTRVCERISCEESKIIFHTYKYYPYPIYCWFLISMVHFPLVCTFKK